MTTKLQGDKTPTSVSRKNSFGSNDSFDNHQLQSWQDQSNNRQDKKKKQLTSEQVVMKLDDGQVFGKDDKSLAEDKIFSQLCPEAKFKQDQQCGVCNNKFKMFSQKKNCKFCGCTVCKDCSKKKRGDPQNRQNFQRICDNCEQKYLNKIIYDEYAKKKDRKEKENQELEQRIKDLEVILKEKQTILNTINNEYQQSKRDLEDKKEFILRQLDNKKREVAALEKENTEYNQQIIAITEQKKKLDAEIEVLEQKAKAMKQDLQNIEKQINALDQDIKQTNAIINQLEENISKMNRNEGKKQQYVGESIIHSQSDDNNPIAPPKENLDSISHYNKEIPIKQNNGGQSGAKNEPVSRDKACYCTIM